MSEAELMQVFQALGLEVWHELGNFAECPTGERYWTVCSEGIKIEGNKAILYGSPEEAVKWYRKVVREIDKRVLGKGSKYIFWRHKPEILYFAAEDGDSGGYTVYSRFRISREKVIQSADYRIFEDLRPDSAGLTDYDGGN